MAPLWLILLLLAFLFLGGVVCGALFHRVLTEKPLPDTVAKAKADGIDLAKKL